MTTEDAELLEYLADSQEPDVTDSEILALCEAGESLTIGE